MEREILDMTDTEEDRRQRLAELTEDQGPDWTVAYAPGSFGWHELLDRTNLVGDLLEQQILSHPACVANFEWYAQAAAAVALLRDLYQQIGASHAGDNASHAEAGRAAIPQS